jgi:hypothetical protein
MRVVFVVAMVAVLLALAAANDGQDDEGAGALRSGVPVVVTRT